MGTERSWDNSTETAVENNEGDLGKIPETRPQTEKPPKSTSCLHSKRK